MGNQVKSELLTTHGMNKSLQELVETNCSIPFHHCSIQSERIGGRVNRTIDITGGNGLESAHKINSEQGNGSLVM